MKTISISYRRCASRVCARSPSTCWTRRTMLALLRLRMAPMLRITRASICERGFEYVLLGEAEWTLERLTSSLIQKRDIRGIPGIAYLNSNGELMRTPDGHSEDGRALPIPARDLIDMDVPHGLAEAHGYFSLNLVTSRGCPYPVQLVRKADLWRQFPLRIRPRR